MMRLTARRLTGRRVTGRRVTGRRLTGRRLTGRRDGRSGLPGRRAAGRNLRALAGVVAAIGLTLTGCGTGPHRARPAASASAAARPAASRSAGGRSAASVAFCRTPPAAGLKAALSRTVRHAPGAEVLPLGISADGRTAYVSTWSAGFSGVAALNLASGGLRGIKSFADPATDQADGSFGGRWLVWEETYSLQSLDDFTIYSWDSATGTLRRLGHSLAGPGGTAWPSPWHGPAVSGNYAAWAQGYGPGGVVEIVLADLQTGQVKVIRRGHVQPPFFDAHLVVWPESDRPGTQTTLRAFSLVTGRPAALPPVLAAVHGTEFVATDGIRTAYFSPDLTRLYYSPAQDQRAQMVLRLPAGVAFANLAIEPGTLAWTTTQATYLASTRTGAYSRVTPEYGYATGSGSVVLISDAPSQKTVHPDLTLHVVDPASIAWPACRGHVLARGQATTP